jgi:trimeric autotransporter adhesin
MHPRFAASNRSLTGPLTFVTLALFLASSGHARTGPARVTEPPAQLEPIRARSAQAMVTSLGLVTHLDYRNTPYGNLQKVTEALKYLGVTNLRDMVPHSYRMPYETLAGLGFKFDFVVRGEGADELSETIRELESFQTRHPGSVAAVEGLNEANNWPARYQGLTGFPAAAALQRDLYAATKGSKELHDVPVYVMTLGGAGESDYRKLGDLSDCADLGNAHIYFPRGSPPSAVWDSALALNRRSTPHLPLTVITETGYTTAVRSEHRVDENVQAKYLLTLIANAWAKGIPRLFVYALIDDSTDYSDWTRGLGLYRFDWTPKPAATAIHRLVRELMVTSEPKPVSDPGSLRFQISSAEPRTQSILLQKGDGTFELLIWREQTLWDGTALRAVPDQTTHISLLLGGRHPRVAIFDPLTGRQEQQSPVNGRVEFDLAGYPLLVAITST